MDDSPLKKSKQGASNVARMDILPVQLIGKIFSHLDRARYVAVASTTCHKWRDAARYHIQKLSFDDSDWPQLIERWGRSSEESWSRRELIISETVMRTTGLKELSICCKNGLEHSASYMHAVAIMACLQHVKGMLRSFKLTSPLTPDVNILERLASSASPLEHLEWHYPDIPTIGTFIHGFPSLVSLALEDSYECDPEILKLLFSSFPKLEHLSIKHWSLVDAPPTMELNICTLKTLILKSIFTISSTTLVLYDHKLGRVHIEEMPNGLVDWKRREGMQYLRLRELHVAEFEVGDFLGHLELEDVHIPLLDIKGKLQHLVVGDSQIELLKTESLDALLELELRSCSDFENAWMGTYSQIMSKAGSNVHKLTVLGALPEKRLVDVDAIASAFPYLQWLSIDFQNFYYDELGVGMPPFMEIRHLSLQTVMLPKICGPFTQWIRGLLRRCPKLNKVVIVLEKLYNTVASECYNFIGELASLLFPIMHPYPHVTVSFQFP